MEKSGKNIKVKLGFLGKKIDEKKIEKKKWFEISKIGGNPIWHNSGPPKDFPFVCKTCGRNLTFVCQISTPYETLVARSIFVFGCHLGENCGASHDEWKIIRCCENIVPSSFSNFSFSDSCFSLTSCSLNETDAKQKELEQEGKKTEENVECFAFSDDWITSAFGEGMVDAFIDEKGKQDKEEIKKNSRKKKKKERQDKNNYEKIEDETFPAYEIVVEDDFLEDNYSECSIEKRVKELVIDLNLKKSSGQYEKEDLADAVFFDGTGEWNTEEYEEYQDKSTIKFLEVMQLNPKQIIRYSFGGDPIWLIDLKEKIKVFFENPKNKFCKFCQSEKVFECQILSTLISQMQDLCVENDRTLAKALFRKYFANWGTVLIYSCGIDCRDENNLSPYYEEIALILPQI